jgi:hypothetical protein
LSAGPEASSLDRLFDNSGNEGRNERFRVKCGEAGSTPTESFGFQHWIWSSAVRAHGGCLGAGRRGRTWQAAISQGEPHAGIDP